MKRIKLTRGKYVILDDDDFWIVKDLKWYSIRNQSGNWYAGSHPNGTAPILMHRLLCGFPPFQLDHRNGNGMDNRRMNLRFANHSQNQANRLAPVRNESGFKGASRDSRKRKSPWRARIKVNDVECWLGMFSSPEEAGIAYGLAAILFFGEFARA